jgi:hypothetical protein
MDTYVEYVLADGKRIKKNIALDMEIIKRNIPRHENGEDEIIQGFVTYSLFDNKKYFEEKYYIGKFEKNNFSFRFNLNNCLYENPEKTPINVVNPKTFTLETIYVAKVTTNKMENVEMIIPKTSSIKQLLKVLDKDPRITVKETNQYGGIYNKRNYRLVTISQRKPNEKTGLLEINEIDKIYVGYMPKGKYLTYTDGNGMLFDRTLGPFKVYNMSKNELIILEKKEVENEN